jgi:hypothetical protein
VEASKTRKKKGLSMDRRLLGMVAFGIMEGTVIFSQMACAQMHCLNPTVKERDDSNKVAVNFLPLAKFSPKQKALLESLVNQSVSQEVWENFIWEHNDQAATFLAVTKTLQSTDLDLGKSEAVSALDMVETLTEIRGVRLIANVNLGYFEKWVEAGGHYALHLVTHKDETGDISFANHSQKGGGLHCGFDIQGYTRYTQPPYIHWNVNRSTGSSDIHLDGRTPWIWGFVPNPTHLEYSNSDVRAWLSEYEKKYGNPGFTIGNR